MNIKEDQAHQVSAEGHYQAND